MLRVVFGILFLQGFSAAPESFSSEFSAAICPGRCLDISKRCIDVREKTNCGAESKCCLDHVESKEQSFDSTQSPQFTSTGSPLEFTTVEIPIEKFSETDSGEKENEFENLSTHSPISVSTTLSAEGEAASAEQNHLTNACPGACIPELYSQYCEYIIPSDGLCHSNSMCCVSGKQAEQMKALDASEEYFADNMDSTDGFSYIDQPSSSLPMFEAGQVRCPGTCIPPSYTVFCDTILNGYVCPTNSKCCNNITFGSSQNVVECTGHCIPDNLRAYCGYPLKLVHSTTCHQGSTCCTQTPDTDLQSEPHPQSQRLSFSSTQNDHTDMGILAKLAKDEQGQMYEISHDGHASMLPFLTPEDHMYNQYTLVTEFDEDKKKVKVFIDENSKLYQQLSFYDPNDPVSKDGHYSFETSQEDEELSQFGMPDADELQDDVENKFSAEVSIPDDKNDIQENMRDIIIPEDGDEVPASDSNSPPEESAARPPCPGSCLSYFLRFTCFGNSATYDGFFCEDSRAICCASTEAIKEREDFLKTLSPFPTMPSSARGADLPTCGKPGVATSDNLKTGISVPGEWCWQVAIISAQNQYLCGGVLIDNRWVLTAAHCVSGAIRDGQQLLVRAGVFDLTLPEDNSAAQTKRVVSAFVHNTHNSVSLDNDIALLKLQTPLELNSRVCVVCLPSPGSMREEGTRCIVTGYGFPTKEGTMSLKTQASEVELIDDTDCMANITDALSIIYLLPASSFCAGNGNGSSCQGDAGGPLVCEKNGFYELVGVLSWTLECGREDVPSVYAKIPELMGWISQVVTSSMKRD